MMIIEVLLLLGLIVLVLWINLVLSPLQSEVEKIIDDSRYPPYLHGVAKSSSHNKFII